MVLIGSDNLKRLYWHLAVVEELYAGRDGIYRLVRLRKGTGMVMRPIQRLYSLEATELNSSPKVAQATLSKGTSGNYISINLSFGFAVTLAILVAGGASGAHINPAVTVALTLVGKFPKEKVCHYLIAQYLGALAASALVFLTYYDNINMEIHRSLYALYIGITVIVLGMSVGYNCGYPLNPARDLSPRLFLLMAGWGKQAFIYRQYWWVGIVGPHIGAILGAFTYVFFIEAQLPKRELKPHDIPLRGWFCVRRISQFSNRLIPTMVVVCIQHINLVLDLIAGVWDIGVQIPFRYRQYWWVGIVGPHIGAILGAFTYVFFIEAQLPKRELKPHDIPLREDFNLGGRAACHADYFVGSVKYQSGLPLESREPGVWRNEDAIPGLRERRLKPASVHQQLQRGAVENEAQILLKDQEARPRGIPRKTPINQEIDKKQKRSSLRTLPSTSTAQ
uniref:DUF5641 domain-containing protein n=1 Tax=Timema cristinae TaxID=61476 RepID=A0A7R9DBM1_TIMCR|nr:unnamed protein product [Timema cristinae]